jgi:hypothetical protein
MPTMKCDSCWIALGTMPRPSLKAMPFRRRASPIEQKALSLLLRLLLRKLLRHTAGVKHVDLGEIMPLEKC